MNLRERMNKTKALQLRRIAGEVENETEESSAAVKRGDPQSNRDVVRKAMRRRSEITFINYAEAPPAVLAAGLDEFNRVFEHYAAYHEFQEDDKALAKEFWCLPENLGSALFDMKTEIALCGIDIPSRADWTLLKEQSRKAAQQLAAAAREEADAENALSFAERRLQNIPHKDSDRNWIVTVVDLFPPDRQEAVLEGYGRVFSDTLQQSGNDSDAQRAANLWLLQEADNFDSERLASSESRRRIAAGFRPA